MPRTVSYPIIPGWSPLQEAESRLFPNTPYNKLTKEQRQEAVNLAKQLYTARTGVPMR